LKALEQVGRSNTALRAPRQLLAWIFKANVFRYHLRLRFVFDSGSNGMSAFTVGQLLRIFVGEGDTWHGRPLYAAIVETLRHEGVAGASVFRGIEGFGGSLHEIHVTKIFQFRGNLPILIEVVDTEDKIASLIPRIDAMVTEGAMTLERIEYRRFSPSKTSQT
jgi:PII-like signaling protein